MTAIRLENPDAVFCHYFNANKVGCLSSVAYNLGLSVIGWDTIGGDETTLGDYATAAGSAAEGDSAGLDGRRANDMLGYHCLNAGYQAAGFPNCTDEAQAWGAYAYDAAKIIIAATDRADTTDPTAIRDEIAATADYGHLNAHLVGAGQIIYRG